MTDYNNLQLQDDYPRKIVLDDKPMQPTDAVRILQQKIMQADASYQQEYVDGLIDALKVVQQADDAKNAARYEYMRRLNVHEFQTLFIKNLSGEARFDDLVDAAIAKQESK